MDRFKIGSSEHTMITKELEIKIQKYIKIMYKDNVFRLLYGQIVMTTTLLIDAVKTLISSDADYNMETWSLNQELADYLATRSEFIIVVTNAPGEKYSKIRELLESYNFQTFSLNNNPPKDQTQYFNELLTYYGLKPEECFYLDHKQDNLDAAAELGIQGVLFVDNKEVIALLQSLIM